MRRVKMTREELKRYMEAEAEYLRTPAEKPLPELPPHLQQFNETPEAKKLREAWELHDKTMLLSDKDRVVADQAFEQARGRRPKKPKSAT